MWRLIFFFFVALAGFWFGKEKPEGKRRVPVANLEVDYPIVEHKSFVFVMYAHNQALWCEKALSSIFEQEYDHYRVILIDDGSTDGTEAKANQFIVDNNQADKVILIRNETVIGEVASFYRAIDGCLDREIVIPLNAKDWLSSSSVLKRLNQVYQNPDVWMSTSYAIHYPSYEIKSSSQISYYAALFKQIRLVDLYQNGHFATSYLTPLTEMAEGRVRHLSEPLIFYNLASPIKKEVSFFEVPEYAPLAAFPKPRVATKADILIFSFDRPMQLYACLESISRYMSGYENLTVLYRSSSEEFVAAYKKVQNAFPLVKFVAQSMNDAKHDFKPNVLKIAFDSPSEYILFAVDDIVVKDFVDLKFCMDQMEKTGAYGFYLRFGKHINFCYQSDKPQKLPPSQPLSSGVYAWDIQTAEGDFGFANSLDMTLFKKEPMKEFLKNLKYKTPNSLEYNLALKAAPKKAIGLYFERSKIVNIPMNIVGRTGNPHMNYLTTEELLAKFNQGLKMDIEPLYKIENRSPHFDYIPGFVLR
jgi:glycosyltransferase involved in cell wall biosynthesis